jgi:long-subunit acyl-CoA synthetase (AMP-forming)
MTPHLASSEARGVLDAATAREKTTLLHAFFHWVATKPDAVFLTQPFPDGTVVDFTWAQTGDAVRRLAAYLAGLGLPPKSNVGLLAKNSAHWFVADLAVWAAGHVSVPCYPTLSTENLAYVLTHAGIELLFVGKLDAPAWETMRAALPVGLRTVNLPFGPLQNAAQFDEIVASTPPLETIPEPRADDLATIMYTSGSTGRPKGVAHTFASMLPGTRAFGELFPYAAQDRFLSYLPLAHAAERALVETPALYNGSHVYFANSLETFAQDLKRARPTIFFSVPRLWTKFYAGINAKLPAQKQRVLFRIPFVSRIVKRKILAELGLDRVRVALTGSAPLSESIVRFYRELGLELYEGYGMSENFAASHINYPGDVRPGYVGRPIPGVECRIAPSGEIEVKSPGQMLEYYKLPELTAETMCSDGFFRTGDRGEIDQFGRLKITGRVKDLFKTSKGKYVAPVPIEQRLGAQTAVEAVCVMGLGRSQPFGLLMLAADAAATAKSDSDARTRLERDLETLREGVNEALEAHERLAFLVIVDDAWTIESGLLTPTMKIRRDELEARYLSRAERWESQGRSIIWEIQSTT